MADKPPDPPEPPPEESDPRKQYDKMREDEARAAKNGAHPPPNGEDTAENVVPFDASKRRKKKATPRSDEPAGVPDTSEMALQLKFSEEHGHTLQHVDTFGSYAWMIWDGYQWKRDKTNRITALIKNLCWKEANASHWRREQMRLAANRTVTAIEHLARSDPRHAGTIEQWDKDPFILGCPTKTVDLRTGIASTPEMIDHVSKYCTVDPAEPGTPAPMWERFLDEITNNDKEYQKFLQKLFGYCLTADVSEEIFVFMYGGGGNGKGTLIRIISTIMGDYWGTVKKELLVRNSPFPSNSDEYYKASIYGKRLITVQESAKGAEWSEDELKEMTGNDSKIVGRPIRGDPFEFNPVAKIIIIGNNKPSLAEVLDAMLRRLKVCPFLFKPPIPDKALKTKLQAEAPQILQWLIQGCLMWQREGLGSCRVVDEATQEYFADQNSFQTWIFECCTIDPTLVLRSKPGPLLASFNAFRRENGQAPIGGFPFSELLDRHPIIRRKRSHGLRWVEGIALKVQKPRDPNAPGDEPNDDSDNTWHT
jgi:putative DNA primase/helicase